MIATPNGAVPCEASVHDRSTPPAIDAETKALIAAVQVARDAYDRLDRQLLEGLEPIAAEAYKTGGAAAVMALLENVPESVTRFYYWRRYVR